MLQDLQSPATAGFCARLSQKPGLEPVCSIAPEMPLASTWCDTGVTRESPSGGLRGGRSGPGSQCSRGVTTTALVYYVIALALFAAIPAALARRKGHSFVMWWIFGALLWIVAIIAVFFVKDKRPRCPECRELVQQEATRCPHCLSEIGGRVVSYATPGA